MTAHDMEALRASMSRDTLLLVDDEADILVALEDLFEDDYRVLKANSGREALDIVARESDIAVILSDQRMPAMTGDVFLTEARAFTRAEAILLTGYADLQAVIHALNNGRIVGYIPKPWDMDVLRSMVRTAADRYRLQRDLDVERRLLNGLMDNIGDAISFKDEAGRFVRLNAAKAERLHQPQDQCLGQSEQSFVTPEAAEDIEELERTALRDGSAEKTLEDNGPDSQPRWTEVRKISLPDSFGTPRHMATVERDITERKQLEQRLRQADKMQALGTLAGGVAHDFNNLLMAILGNLDLAKRNLQNPEKLERLLGNAHIGASRGASLTRRLLDFSRSQSHEVKLLDANRVIEDMRDFLASSLGSLVPVFYELSGDLPPVMLDGEQLELAILNLCINARDAMPTGGRINITTRSDALEAGNRYNLSAGTYVVVSVRDSGMGIPPEVLARVFEPFFTTKDVGQGTGLGLTMVYSFVEQSGGAIDIISKEGSGTTVELFLPEGREAQPAPDESSIAGSEPAARLSILLVDDDPHVREITASLLADLGHAVTQTENAEAALTHLEGDHAFDMLVADVAMPRVTGTELAQRARVQGFEKPILLISGFVGDADTQAFPVLMKPFQRDDLAQKLQDALSANC